ncbi:hypothetical protein [Sorangium sp. So ce542]|uniref:hypothetical protein n=1 Tax=Sorangium sp. So ce542 TaxID=3133316 RepID=UPI003F61D117
MSKRIERHRNAKERFEKSDERSVTDNELALDLRKHLWVNDAELPASVEVECRGNTCRVAREGADASDGPVVDIDWARRNVRDVASTRNEIYYGLRGADEASGFDILMDIIVSIRQAGSIDDCTARFHDAGTLEVRFNLREDEDDTDEFPPGLSFDVSGRLVGTRLGECISDALQHACNSVDLPSAFLGSSLRWVYPESPELQ